MSTAIASRPKPATTEAGRKLTELANRYRQGETDVATEVIEHAERFVISVVHRHATILRQGRYDFDDLISAGRIGLLEALRRFDGRGAFSTYAVHWIRKEVNEVLYTNTSALSISLGTYNRLLAARKGYGQAPLKPDQLMAAEIAMRRTSTLEEGYYLTDESDGPESRISRETEAERIRAAVASLPDRQAKAIWLYYGLGGQRPKTHREIGRVLGCTGSRS